MRKTPYAYVEPVRRHSNYLMDHGVPQNVIEDSLGVTKEALADDETKIRWENNIGMLKKGLAFIGPAMAVEMGATACPEIIGVLGQIMKNCRNLKEAAQQLIRYQSLIFSVSEYKIRIESNCIFFVHTIDFPICDDDRRLLNELNLSICVASIRQLLRTDFAPKEMHFSYGRPDHSDVYKKHFQCPLRFNQKEDAIVIEKHLAEKPIPGSYPYMKDILTQYTDNELAKRNAEKHFQEDVKGIIIELLPKGLVSIERISRELAVSRWTLARKLRQEGTTFKAFLSAVRKELAIRYIETTQWSTNEIALLLGYSEASAFQRAFKTWTGKSPNAFRIFSKNRLVGE